MRFLSRSMAWVLCALLTVPALGQQTATTSSQARTLLQSSFAVLTGGQSVSDVVLSGTARRIAGSDDESGTVVLKAMSTGEASVSVTLPSGVISEVWSSMANGPAGNWVGPDGKTHEIAMHNCWTDAAWFFPGFNSAFVTAQSVQISYVGQETLDGATVQHIRTNRVVPGDASGNPSALVSHLSQTELYLDAQSFLPVAVTFNVHPDENASVDIPVQIKYADFRSVGGMQIPFHVQRYVQNSLQVDLQLSSTNFNTGLSASQFAIQ